MWELYALWTWLPAFLLGAPNGPELPASPEITMFLAMGVAGVIGCLLGGWGADRFGRPPAAAAALAVSGLCCLLSPLAFGASPTLLFVFCAIWGAAVIADSGVFSTLLSEEADTRFVGTALTAQTAIGFGLTTGEHPTRSGSGGDNRLAVRLPASRPRPRSRGTRHKRNQPSADRTGRVHLTSATSVSEFGCVTTTVEVIRCSRRSRGSCWPLKPDRRPWVRVRHRVGT
jgi:hypothetical protein